MSDIQDQKNPPRERIRLPFEKRPSDIGAWSYDHRVGLCITVIVYLVAAIVFVSVRIAVGQKAHLQGFYIDMQDEPEQPIEKPDEQRGMLAAEYDFSDVRNLASNENAQELNERLRDAHGTNASEIYDEAAAAQERMRANREAFERGLSENDALAQRTPTAVATGERREDVKVKGRVTVSFSLSNPVRTSEKLVVPAYLCEGGGQVVVTITVDRSGYVTAASVDRARSSADACMTSTAVEAARQSRFNLDTSAPEKHQGTITYIFIPQ